ncbi:uncharacterized protein LOC144909092 [Branchiostoma floridae x Branchiostoma belcheri]
MPTQLQYMNSSPGVRNSMRWAAEPPAVTQPVTTLDPRPPYAVARPRSAPIRPRPDKWVDPYVDPRPQFRTTSAIVHRARRKPSTSNCTTGRSSHTIANMHPSPPCHRQSRQPPSFPSYDPMSDPHLSDYFARKFGYDPRPPSAVDSQPYSSIVTQVVLKSLSLVDVEIDGLLQIFSSFQKQSMQVISS